MIVCNLVFKHRMFKCIAKVKTSAPCDKQLLIHYRFLIFKNIIHVAPVP